MTKTEITFENATLAEIVKRADRVTPKKGEAFDKASGLVFDIDPSAEWGVTIRATNLDVYYTEWVNHLGASGDKVTWRVSSHMFVALITKLPIGTGKTVTLWNDGGMLHVKSGRFKAKLALIDPTYYPRWTPFNPQGTAPVANLGARIEQVAWAVSKGENGSAMTGIRFDGRTLAATDRYRLASVPCEAPHITQEITVPASVVGPLIKQMGDTNVGIVEGQLVFMPNEYTQIRCVIFEVEYPKIERVMHRDHPYSIKFERTSFVEAIGRVITADQKNRMPELRMFIGEGEVAFYMEDGGGRDSAGDVLELPGQAPHERFELFITPSSITDALQASPNERVELFYDPSNRMKILRIDGGSGYESWVVPRTGIPQKPEGES